AWLYEFTRNPHRKYLLRHFRKNTGVLFYQLISASVFGRILERYSGDELYFYTYWFHHATLMLAFLKKQDKIRSFVSRAHSIDLYNEHWLYAGDRHKPLPYAWFKMKYIRKVAAISEHGKEHLLKEFPDCREKISRSYLGVPDNGPGVSLPLQPFVIASCSNFTGNKRVWLIPEILGGLGKDIRWVHFGSGGNTESQVKKAAEKFLSPEQVIFAGHVPTAAIMEYYRTHPVHLFMNMSRAEGLPVSIMEAISFGIPVIATDVYGTPELLSGGNGFLVSADDPVAKIAGLVDQLRNDAQLHKKMGEASRKLFLEKFSAGKTYPDFIRKVLHGLSDN
ncbi:MAG TPA: glycosyltransferase, partial [Bacteroidia bacterium]|nr:glycosyltransferase [Bacteroidia bacterium]